MFCYHVLELCRGSSCSDALVDVLHVDLVLNAFYQFRARDTLSEESFGATLKSSCVLQKGHRIDLRC